jgi:ferredoxin
MLRYGVPKDRLPCEVLDAEIALISKIGATLQLGKRIENAESLNDLRRKFDAVLLATGEMDKESARKLGLVMGAHGLHVDRSTLMTASPGIFAAGSAVTPSHHAVRAVSDGRAAAIAIDSFLRKQPPSARHTPYSVHIGRLTDGEMSIFLADADKSGRVTPASDTSFSPVEATGESARCLHCECDKLDDCKLRNYAVMYGANAAKFRGERQAVTREQDHAHVIYEPGKCISCGLCVQLTAEAGEQIGLTFIGRGFHVRPGVPFNEPLSNALRKVAEECVKACPTGALVRK